MALLRKTFRKNYTGQEFRVGENYHRREENRMNVGLFMSACKFCKQLSSKQINRVDNAFQTRESRCPPFISSFQPFHDHFSFLFFLSDMHAVWLSLQPCLIWVWLHLKFKKLCSLFFPLLFMICFLLLLFSLTYMQFESHLSFVHYGGKLNFWVLLTRPTWFINRDNSVYLETEGPLTRTVYILKHRVNGWTDDFDSKTNTI